jgi:hypothetical protein
MQGKNTKKKVARCRCARSAREGRRLDDRLVRVWDWTEYVFWTAFRSLRLVLALALTVTTVVAIAAGATPDVEALLKLLAARVLA